MRSLKQLWEIHFHELKNIDDHKVSVDIRLMADLLAKQDIYVAGKKVNLMHYNPELVDPVMEKVDRLREYYYACLKDNDYSILISKDVTLEDIEREAGTMNQEEWLYHWKRGFWEGRWDVISRIEQAMSYRGKDIETVLGVIREIKEELAED